MITDHAHSWLIRSAPAAAAQAAGRPLVALESTIIAHGMPYPENVRTAREVETLIRNLGAEPAIIALIGLAGGVVLSTPVPEAAAMAREEIDALTQLALAESRQRGITGKALTPFLLAHIKSLTGGRSLATNIALLKHNAEVGAKLALALALQ